MLKSTRELLYTLESTQRKKHTDQVCRSKRKGRVNVLTKPTACTLLLCLGLVKMNVEWRREESDQLRGSIEKGRLISQGKNKQSQRTEREREK